MRSVLRRLVRPRIFAQSTTRSSSDHRGAFKAASNAFVAEEQALGDVGPNGVLRAFKTASTHIEPRRLGLYQQTGGRISCYPSPTPSGSASTSPARRRRGQEGSIRQTASAYAVPYSTTRRLGFFGGFVARAPILLERDDAARRLSLPPMSATETGRPGRVVRPDRPASVIRATR